MLVCSTNAVMLNEKFWDDLTQGLSLVASALYDDLTSEAVPLQPDAYKSDAEVYQSNGYRFEEHKILTEDGYILSAWRIPGKLTDSMKDLANRPPVMLQHGLLDNSATWTINYFNQTLPYLLLEEGYDVWITNNRGNFNSYEHSDPQNYSVFKYNSPYWNFTFDGMARYDLPATIDYILDYTNNTKLVYVGHSQGTVQFFAANCLQNLAAKIEAFVGLGPVMYVNHTESPIAALGVASHFDSVLTYFGWQNIMLWPKVINIELKTIVAKIKKTVWRFVQLICGVGEEINMDLERIPVMGRHEPGGTSLTNMLHWLQMMKTGEFKMMDFGEEENLRVYNQPTPPFYNVKAMKRHLKDLDMYLIRGGNDSLVSKTDFNMLLDHFSDKLGSTLNYHEVPTYGHLDYIWAKDSLETVNKPVIEFLRQRKK